MFTEGFDIESSTLVDHIDGNTLNNSIDNLRAADHKSNSSNMVNAKGYYYSSKLGKYCAQFQHKHIGVFDTEVEASLAYLDAKHSYLDSIHK